MNQKPIWKATGNPFVDMGQEMMASLVRVDQLEELTIEAVESLLPRMTNLYFQEAWNKTMYSIFPNSPLTNAATKHRQQTYLNLLRQWLSLAAYPQSDVIADTACTACGNPAQRHLSDN